MSSRAATVENTPTPARWTPPKWTEAWTSLDERSLGAFRVLFGFILVWDVARRFGSAGLWLAGDGIMAHPSRPVSWLFWCATRTEATIALAICGVVFALYLVGWRTRVVQVLALVAAIGLHNRCWLVERSGEKVIDLLLLWTVFLPLGRRFSVDARRGRAGTGEPVRTVAVLALLVQLAGIYALAGVQKNGLTWQEGHAIHYLLQRNDVVTALGVRVRDHLPQWLLGGLCWTTLAIEYVLPLLLLSPVATVAARRLAIVLTIALNGGIALAVDLGIYQPTMLSVCLLLLSPRDWDWLARRLRLPSLATAPPVAAPRGSTAPSTARRWFGLAHECAVLLLLVGAIGSACNQNAALARLRHTPGAIEELLSTTLGMPEAWARFAPDVPTSFRMITVDARTADGRRVDPLNSAARGQPTAPLVEVPDRLGYDTFWHNYDRIINTPQFGMNEARLTDWIARSGDHSGNPNDRIVSFEIVALWHYAPPPGSSLRVPTKRVVLVSRVLDRR